MKKVSKLAACGILSVTMAASVLSGCGEQKPDGNQTALVIDGEDVSLGLASYFLRTDQARTYAEMLPMMQYFSPDGKTFWGSEAEDGVTYAESFKESEMANITNLLTLRKHAEEYGVAITPEDQTAIETAAKAFYEKNIEALEKMGTQVGNIEEALELKTIELRMKKPMTVDVDMNVSDEEAAQTSCTYIRLKKPDDAAEAETAKTSMQEILDKILALKTKADADLKEIANEVAEDTYTTQYHYKQDAYADEDNVLDAAVKEVLPDLKDGEVYDQLIEGESYFYIVRMDHYFDKEKTETEKETIRAQRISNAYTEILEGWTAAVDTEEKDCWNNLEVSDDSIYTVPMQ